MSCPAPIPLASSTDGPSILLNDISKTRLDKGYFMTLFNEKKDLFMGNSVLFKSAVAQTYQRLYHSYGVNVPPLLVLEKDESLKKLFNNLIRALEKKQVSCIVFLPPHPFTTILNKKYRINPVTEDLSVEEMHKNSLLPIEDKNRIDYADHDINGMAVCEACKECMIQPILIQPCRHTVCRYCLDKAIQYYKKYADENSEEEREKKADNGTLVSTSNAALGRIRCILCPNPECKKIAVSLSIITKIEKYSNELDFHCPYAFKGCIYTGNVESIKKHLKHCPLAPDNIHLGDEEDYDLTRSRRGSNISYGSEADYSIIQKRESDDFIRDLQDLKEDDMHSISADTSIKDESDISCFDDLSEDRQLFATKSIMDNSVNNASEKDVEISNLQIANDKLKEKVEQLILENEVKMNEINKLKKFIEKNDIENKTEIESKDIKLKEYEEKEKKLTEKITEQEQIIAQKILEMEDDKKLFDKSIAENKELINALEKKNELLKEQTENLIKTNTLQNEKYEQLLKANEKLQESIEEVKINEKNKEDLIEKKNNELEKLTKDCTSLNAIITTLKKSNIEKETENIKLNKTEKFLQEKCLSLEEEKKNQESAIDKLNKNIEEIVLKYEKVNKENEKIKQDLIKLNEDNTKKEEKIIDYQKNEKNLENLIHDYEKNIKIFKEEITELSAKNKEREERFVEFVEETPKNTNENTSIERRKEKEIIEEKTVESILTNSEKEKLLTKMKSLEKENEDLLRELNETKKLLEEQSKAAEYSEKETETVEVEVLAASTRSIIENKQNKAVSNDLYEDIDTINNDTELIIPNSPPDPKGQKKFKGELYEKCCFCCIRKQKINSKITKNSFIRLQSE